jgi:hypothetical protein
VVRAVAGGALHLAVPCLVQGSPMPPIAAAVRSVLPAGLGVEQLGQFGGERGEVLALVYAGKFVE